MLLARIDQPETPIKRVFNSHVDPYITDATVSEGREIVARIHMDESARQKARFGATPPIESAMRVC